MLCIYMSLRCKGPLKDEADGLGLQAHCLIVCSKLGLLKLPFLKFKVGVSAENLSGSVN